MVSAWRRTPIVWSSSATLVITHLRRNQREVVLVLRATAASLSMQVESAWFTWAFDSRLRSACFGCAILSSMRRSCLKLQPLRAMLAPASYYQCSTTTEYKTAPHSCGFTTDDLASFAAFDTSGSIYLLWSFVFIMFSYQSRSKLILGVKLGVKLMS